MNKLKKDLLADKATILFLEQIAGPLATDVVKLFKNNALSPEVISKKLKEKITNVRSTLNSLHYRGIACYKKQRNDKNMYEFMWEIKYKKIIEIILLQEMKKYKKLDITINEKEHRDYFYCPKKCGEMPFEVAAAYNFKCPNCNLNLEMVNIKNKLNKLKRDRKKVEGNISKLESIMEKIKDNTRGYVCD